MQLKLLCCQETRRMRERNADPDFVYFHAASIKVSLVGLDIRAYFGLESFLVFVC